MDDLSLLQRIAVWSIPVIFAITVHEVSHGWVAQRFGDPTAKMLGRLTLNPVKHIDPVGTIAVPLLLALTSPFLFGWAKPVPVDPRNFKDPRRDMAWVALAGPMSNLLMAILWGLVFKFTLVFSFELATATRFLLSMASAGILINFLLMVLNLIPIPPLDGSKVLAGVLPPAWARQFDRLERYTLLMFGVLIVLMVSGLLGKILVPAVDVLQRTLFALLAV